MAGTARVTTAAPTARGRGCALRTLPGSALRGAVAGRGRERGGLQIPENDHWDWGSLRWDDLDPGPGMAGALAFVERVKNASGQWETREISPFFSNRPALRNWAVVPDSPASGRPAEVDVPGLDRPGGPAR